MTESPTFPALVVHQWLADWNAVHFDEESFQERPPENFLLFSMPARQLRQLSDTYRRDASAGVARGKDTGVQRKHDESRSEEIARFVRDGYPLSSLSSAKRASASGELRKPGWLPTAIVINILDPLAPRAGRKVVAKDAIGVPSATSWLRGSTVEMTLPESWKDKDWTPEDSFPIEVIDGQHRLWSFGGDESDADFDLPVVAFVGLDISWQAYLFWTINIKPKKINASLAYDLYPLLRDQEWLIAGEGLDVYRETRSQELTESLWAHPESPWYQRINMLGETGLKTTQPVTQAAFVRSLSESLVRPWTPIRSRIGGLYGGSKDGRGLEWSRAQQSAFLIDAWRSLSAGVANSDSDWAEEVRKGSLFEGEVRLDGPDLAFAGRSSLLASDQGIRAFHQALNDIFYVAQGVARLHEWGRTVATDDTGVAAVAAELEVLESQDAHGYLVALGAALGSFDWRNASAPGLSKDQLLAKQALRGTGGYRLLREALLGHLADGPTNDVAGFAQEALELRQ